jgi:hypothetical protein
MLDYKTVKANADEMFSQVSGGCLLDFIPTWGMCNRRVGLESHHSGQPAAVWLSGYVAASSGRVPNSGATEVQETTDRWRQQQV